MSDNRERFVPQAINMKRPGRPVGGRMAPVEKPRDLKGALRRLWRYFSGERRAMALVFALVAASAALSLVTPLLLGRAIDALSPGAGTSPVFMAVMLLAAAYGGDALCSFAQSFLMAGIAQRTVRVLRSALFDHFQRLPISFFDAHTHGDLMSRLTNDIDNISSTVSSSASQLMSLAITLTGSLVMMLVLSPAMTVGLIIPSTLALILSRFITKRTGPLFRAQQATLGALTAQLEESISALPAVRAFNRERAVTAQFSTLNDRYYRTSLTALIWSGFLMPLMNILNNLAIVLVSALGSGLIVRGAVAVGTIASFIAYARQFVRPLNDVASIYNTLQTAVAGAERVFELFDAAEESPDPPDAQPLTDIKGDVSFEHVTFGYRSDVLVLNDITFTVPAGSSLALVGETGAGKTTLVNLLARFYEINSGRITIDGQDIRSVTRASLRQAFGIVLQDTVLFHGTIRENIRYGNPNATDEQVTKAAREACADGFIERLPDGYDTALQESGGNLSMGQRQLLAIARAILADSPILILDEATSSVDTRTELNIQRAMLQLMAGRTTFIIAHRLSTIAGADRILVMDKGRIAEQGTHKALLERDGIYAALWRAQLENG